MSVEPQLSFVLVTDTYETIRPVVRALAAQTVAGALELVLVGPAGAPLRVEDDDVAGFAAHRVVPVESILPLAPARAAGVRATTAPLVNVGETHAFHHPGFAAASIAAFDDRWTAVVPGFDNGNPGSAASWANFLLDYSRWSRALPGGEIDFLPAYNTTFTRDFLVGLGGGLDEAFGVSHDIGQDLRSGGYRTRFEPAAGIDHVNVSRPPYWIKERFLLARSQAAIRSESWTRGHRAVYVLGSPLIPAVLLARLRHGFAAVRRRRPLPALTVPGMVVGLVLRVAGEVTGFVFGATDRHHLGAEEFEVHKLRYTHAGARRPARAPARRERTEHRASAR